jgi:hypothetical protein
MKAFKQKLFIFFILLLVNSLSAFAQEYVYVSVEKTDLKNGIGFFAEKVAQLKQFLINFVSAETVDEKAKILFDSFKNTTANTVENYLGDSFARTLEEHLYKKLE